MVYFDSSPSFDKSTASVSVLPKMTCNRARVDGGGGIDTLQLEGADLTLDLTKISDRRIQDIEVIDMTGSGDNTPR
jgi:hypothetical protein